MATEKKKRGCFMTIPTILFFITLFVAACIAVALIMWFAIPRKKCATGSGEYLKESCMSYIDQVGKDTFCEKSPDVLKMEEEEKRKMEEEEMKRQEEEEKKRQEEERVAAEKAAEAAALRTGLRLNKTLVPHHYDLSLWPRFYEGDDFSFTGNVTIHFTCKEETDVIVLHIDKLTIQEEALLLRYSNLAENRIDRTEEDKPRQFYKIYPETQLMRNKNYTLQMSFSGTLIHRDSSGFFRDSYVENNKTNWIVLTKFQVTGARRAFPVFDEPFFRATFSVTMLRKDNYVALCNTDLRNTVIRGGDWYADIFEKTPPIPPYQLAFTVNQFVYLEKFTSRGTRMRVYTQPSLLVSAEYANNISATIMEAFEEWTGIPYPLNKFDQYPVPGFAFGSPLGLVGYRDIWLLYNPNFTETNLKFNVAHHISAAIAKQWFANLVTCRWWDDVFLNEAFAEYLAYHVGTKAVDPSLDTRQILLKNTDSIMTQDVTNQNPPIRQQGLEHHGMLRRAFSQQVLWKGPSIVRMLRDFLGPETFKRGMQKYLQDNMYKSVVDEDLYRALQTQAEADGSVTWDTQKTNLSGILKTWMDQRNFPLLHVTDLADGSLKATQSHFLYDQEEEDGSYPTPLGSEFLWDIPVTYTDTTLDPKFDWMYRQKEVRLQGLQKHGWKFLNPKLYGYYRVRYGDETWNAILYQLMRNHTVFPLENRAGFISDAFQIARTGQMEEVDALRSTEYMKYEQEYLPWNSIRIPMDEYLNKFFGKPVYDELERYLTNLVIPIYNLLGWDVPSNPGVAELTRKQVIKLACDLKYKPCVDQALKLYRQYMNNPDTNPIHPDLRPAVYCTALANGGMAEWEFLWDRYLHDYGDVHLGFENLTVSWALPCPARPNVIRRFLDMALALNSTIMFSRIAVMRDARDTTWNYMEEHWDDFTDGNKMRIYKGSVLYSLTFTWNTDADLRKLDDFRMTHNETALAWTYDLIVENIKQNKDWLDDNMAPIENWLKAVNSGQSYKRMSSGRRRRRSVSQNVIRAIIRKYSQLIKTV